MRLRASENRPWLASRRLVCELDVHRRGDVLDERQRLARLPVPPLHDWYLERQCPPTH
jgi:hypothetical protein